MPWLVTYHMLQHLEYIMWYVRAYHMAMWYAFWSCDMLFDHVVYLFITTENFNLGYLKVRIHSNHSLKSKCVWSMDPYSTRWVLRFSFTWHYWAFDSWSMAPYTYHTIIWFSLNTTSLAYHVIINWKLFHIIQPLSDPTLYTIHTVQHIHLGENN